MTHPPLACSVRGCGAPLTRGQRTWSCPAGHSYDIARSGYVNLLQPQDRRSPEAGDSKETVEARSALLAAGIGRGLVHDVVARVSGLGLGDAPVVADLGSGSGDALGALATALPLVGVGVDISAAAAEHAARRFPSLTWVVANADRRLPLLDGSVDLVLSLNGRRNPAECARVLTANGSLLVALPAPDDLIELRRMIQGEGHEVDRGEAMLAEHQTSFTLADRWTSLETQAVDRESLLRVLRGTYRGARLKLAERVDALGPMEVTFSSNVFVLRPVQQ